MDRRIKYTKEMIKNTFIKLLNEKEINKITVSEICTLADINRATFYRYYLDPYDLLEQIQNNFVEDLREAIKDDNIYTVSTFSKKILNIFLENKDLVRILFTSKNGSTFLDNILKYTYNQFLIKWKKELKDEDYKNIKLTNIFVFNGALGIINYWIENDFNESTDYIANTIESLSYFGTYKFINRN